MCSFPRSASVPCFAVPPLLRPACFAPNLPHALQWLEDNTPYDPKSSGQRQSEEAGRRKAAWMRNLFLIAMQASATDCSRCWGATAMLCSQMAIRKPFQQRR